MNRDFDDPAGSPKQSAATKPAKTAHLRGHLARTAPMVLGILVIEGLLRTFLGVDAFTTIYGLLTDALVPKTLELLGASGDYLNSEWVNPLQEIVSSVP